VLILADDVRAETGFAALVRFILGDAGVPFDWEYGTHGGGILMSSRAASVSIHSALIRA
jgi:hypothetical protein